MHFTVSSPSVCISNDHKIYASCRDSPPQRPIYSSLLIFVPPWGFFTSKHFYISIYFFYYYFSIVTLSLKCFYSFYLTSLLLFPLACFPGSCPKCKLWECKWTSPLPASSGRTLGVFIKNFPGNRVIKNKKTVRLSDSKRPGSFKFNL